MDSETWRVVLESGEVMEVLVWQGVTAGYYATHDGMEVRALDANPRAAICTLAGHGSWPVREIVAPGEATAEERYAAWAALDALLRGAPCGYVPVPVVQRCLDAVDEWERERSAPVARTVARAAMVAARTALDAALAAATTTPKESL